MKQWTVHLGMLMIALALSFSDMARTVFAQKTEVGTPSVETQKPDAEAGAEKTQETDTVTPPAQTPEPEAEILPVETIVEKANQVAYYAGKDGRAEVSMTVTDSRGRERKRRFIILRRDDPPPKDTKIQNPESYCGDQRIYVYFRRPADISKMVFMVHKHITGDDDRWLYLPALDNVKRIAASDKRTSFVGSHFFYEDVSGRSIEADSHELLETTDDYYILKNVPKKPDTVKFGYYKAYVHRKTFLPVKIEYFDKKGEKYREYEALKVETIQGHLTVIQSRMKDLRAKGETVLEYSGVKYDIGLPEDVFTERYLRKPPKKYLKK